MLSLNITILVQLALFLTVMCFLNFFLFRPLGRLHDRREGAFRKLQDEIDTLEEKRKQLIAGYQERLEAEKHQILAYKTALKESLDSEKAAIISQARQQSEKILRKEEEDLQAAVVAARQTLDSQARQVADAIFSKIIGRKPEMKRP